MLDDPSLPHSDLGARADQLADTHVLHPPLRRYNVRRRLEHLGRRLDDGRKLLSTVPAAEQLRISEWLLDNDYVVEQAIEQVIENLPRHFVRQLPSVTNRGETPASPRLRVHALAEEFLAAMEGQIWPDQLEELVRAYDQRAPLTMGELWALPTALRWAVIERLTRLTLRIENVLRHGTVDEITAKDQSQVALSIVSLRTLDSYDWRLFFEQTSVVERILRQDPTGFYPEMDFASRDRYRKRVERLAQRDPDLEHRVAATALQLARSGDLQHERHVGHYLLGAGLAQFLTELGVTAPTGLRIVLFHRRHGLRFLVGTVAGLALGLGLLAALVVHAAGGELWMQIVAGLLTFFPGTSVAWSVVTFMSSRVLQPRILPRLDFEERGIPGEWRTLVVLPALVGSETEIGELFEGLERNYLRNPDPALGFALLSDFADADQETLESDQALLATAVVKVEELNRRHGDRFFLFHRHRQWNPGQRCWMAWERKRGKLQELNRWLRGASDTSFSTVVGDRRRLDGVRFVLTLDADTVLPRAGAARLIGTLAHPINRAVFDAKDRVISGYTVLQPRVGIDPRAANRSRFSRVYSGETGLDLYTHASSDVYQDMFGEGSFAGKGLYNVDTFERSLAGRVPENSLLSHDLFEGVHGRAALISDTTVLEDIPFEVTTYMRRYHRWVRGDWQLLPWLFSRVPLESGDRGDNPLSFLDRTKIADNMRRSLVPPALLLLLLLGWFLLPARSWLWTASVAALVGSPVLFTSLAQLLQRARGAARADILLRLRSLAREVRPQVSRWALALVFLPYEAHLSVDAIARTIVRMFVTHRNRLEWTTAAHASRGTRSLPSVVAQMVWPLALSTVGLALLTLRPEAATGALPLLLIWLASPMLAHYLSQERLDRPYALNPRERRLLRRTARRTWLFFEQFVGPNDHWLPPDNYQEDPKSVIAHRTSPTNIGLLLLSTVAAYDLGFVSLPDLVARLRNTLDTLARLERFRGHWFNWYHTLTLEPLAPRYMSTVDSGNLAAALLVVAEVCRQIVARQRLTRSSLTAGLEDLLDVFERVVANVETRATASQSARLSKALLREVGEIRGEIQEQPTVMPRIERFESIGEKALQLAEAPGSSDAEPITELRIWLERIYHHLDSMKREAELLQSGEAVSELVANLGELERRARDSADQMQFGFLYDKSRELFHIGFNVDTGIMDPNYYDLLASESRIASLVAIAKGDVPERHWLHLGRPLTRVGTRRVLLSWSATMFEYLMPLLFMPAPPNTLLSQSCEGAVRRQISFARRFRVPWGISESAFFHFDSESTYQYKAFGVPGLGLKRDAGHRLVVSPYSSCLALPVRTSAVLSNLRRLERLGMLGRYGWYEAIDFGPAKLRWRAPHPRRVRSYMAHHQGMILAALVNTLGGSVLVNSLMANARLNSTLLLLHERRPEAPTLRSRRGTRRRQRHRPPTPPSFSWRLPPTVAGKQCHVVSNGRLSAIATSAGGVGVRYKDKAVTRFVPDSVREPHGGRIFLQDLDSGELWTTGESPAPAVNEHYDVMASPDRVRFQRRSHEILSRLDISVLPRDDLLLERLVLVNESARPRRLAVIAYGEMVLGSTIDDRRHPAFNNLFVTANYDPDREILHFRRRPCAPQGGGLHAAYRMLHPPTASLSWCTSRGIFLGRAGSIDEPAALASKTSLDGDSGPSLDPIYALRLDVTVPIRSQVEVCLLCGVGATEVEAAAALDVAPSMSVVAASFDRARVHHEIVLHDLGIAPADLPLYQKLHSCITFPDRRRDGDGLSSFPRSRLWAHGISGDHPILLLEVDELDHASFVRQLFQAHAWWRRQGIRVDLVVIDHLSSGYDQPLRERLQQMVVDSGGDAWVGQPGGIHLLSEATLADDLPGLEQMASLTLHARGDPFSQQIDARRPGHADLPAFVSSPPAKSDMEIAPIERPSDLVYDNGFGGFSANGHEYVIHLEPGDMPPAPWCNVIANPQIGCVVSESSLGCTWVLNSHENRLTPWRNDPVLDDPSEVVYLRDEETGDVWSATPRPAPAGAAYQIRHGQGYTEYRHHSHGLEQSLVVFAEQNEPVKFVEIHLRNRWPRERRLTLTYYCEWVIGTLRELSARHVVTAYDPSHQCLLAFNPASDDFADRVAFVASSEPAHGLTADRVEFLGQENGMTMPAGLRRIGLSGRVDWGNDPCAALQVHVDLEPGEEKRLHFVLGQGASRQQSLALARRFRDRGAAKTAWKEAQSSWRELLSRIQVETPDPATNFMLNGWLLYQTLSSRLWGRSSHYQSGGAFGFRDQLQDVLALLQTEPAMVREQILRACEQQFAEGDVLHWWHPPTGRGLRSRCSDDLLWLPYTTALYVDRTGDHDVLAEHVAFREGRALADDEVERYDLFLESAETAPVYEHCLRAIERGTTSGRHGLPLIGASDWNDGMNRVGLAGEGESVWLAWFLADTLERFIKVCEIRGDTEKAETLRVRASAVRAAVDETAWDGAWYRRAYYDDGTPIGSRESDECEIDLIAQAWSVLSGPTDRDRARQAMDAAYDRLMVPEHGLIRLLEPPFDRGCKDPGYIKGYPPGVRENGGQYTHAAVWGAWAVADLGQLDRFGALWRALLPPRHSETRDDAMHYRVEPYVTAADIYGAPPWVGRGGWTWYTGSAAWLYRLGIERLLGLVQRGRRLCFAPALPVGWSPCRIEYRYGKTLYRIGLDAGEDGGSEVASVRLDGIEQDGSEIELDPHGGTHEVGVTVRPRSPAGEAGAAG